MQRMRWRSVMDGVMAGMAEVMAMDKQKKKRCGGKREEEEAVNGGR